MHIWLITNIPNDLKTTFPQIVVSKTTPWIILNQNPPHVDMHNQDYSRILEVISDHPSCQDPLVFQQLYKAYAIVSLSPPSYMQLCYLSKLVVTGTTSKAEKGLSVLCCLVHRHATLKLVYKFFIFLVHRHATHKLVYSVRFIWKVTDFIYIWDVYPDTSPSKGVIREKENHWRKLRYLPRPAISLHVQCPLGYTLPPETWQKKNNIEFQNTFM